MIWYAKCNLLKNLEIWEIHDSFLRIVNPKEAFKEDTAIEDSVAFDPDENKACYKTVISRPP